MSAILKKQVSYIFNSDPTSGAQNVSTDGSSFQVSLNYPIAIPRSAIDAEGAIISASIWNTSPNIAAAFGNNIFRFTTFQAPAGTYTITIPDGLYSVEGLNAYLSSQFVNIGLPANLISIAGDDATQKTLLTIEFKNDSVDFTVANSVRTVLGFNAAVLTAPSNGFTFLSDTQAAFNRNNSLVIASTLVSQGIPVNNQSAGIIGLVPISVPPGSQINYQPTNPEWFDARELIGQPKINIALRLLNQNLQTVPTSGDSYSFIILMRYSVLISSGAISLKP
jgi:hypothetical protein